MPHWEPRDTRALSDAQYQDYILQGVSRTFALTIPQLPGPLRSVVGNAYLLCRITDTIEDEPALDAAARAQFAHQFIEVVEGRADSRAFAEQLGARLTESTPAAERELIRDTARVLDITRSFTSAQQGALIQCVREMTLGMIHFQRRQSPHGLRDLDELGEYCYYVAGVVGVMLTDLFCDYSPDIARNRQGLLQMAQSFGQGLQMTNILKDVWEDHQRGVCWLPRDVFAECGFELAELGRHADDPCFRTALGRLIGLAQQHLRNALQYTLLIPPGEKGIRKFCFWALGMALLTLRKLNKHRDYRSGQEVKIGRASVRATILATELVGSGDRVPRWLFQLTCVKLPETEPPLSVPSLPSSAQPPL